MSSNDEPVPRQTESTHKTNGKPASAGDPSLLTDEASSSLQTLAPEALSPEASASPGRNYRRLLFIVPACALSLGAVLSFGFWMHYRHVHVLSRNAKVWGQISNVGAQFRGVVADVMVDSGDHVRAGQVIARLEDEQLRARVDQAQSSLEKASRELAIELLAITHARQRLESAVMEASAKLEWADAQLEAAKSRAKDAREQYELSVSLSEEGVVPRDLVRKSRADDRTADALVFAAEAERGAASAARHTAIIAYDGLSLREKRVTLLESQVAEFQAELGVARADLAAAQIRAPGDGRVVRRIAEPGTSLDNGQPILALWMDDRLWVEAWIDEGDVSHVGIGSPATVTLKPYPDRVFSGVVEAMGVSTDLEVPQENVPQPRFARMRGTPVVPVRVRLDDRDVNLVPGLSAVVAIRKAAAGVKASASENRGLSPMTFNKPR